MYIYTIMSVFFRFIFTVVLLSAVLVSCAKRGSPSGGDKDETPPKFVKANPEPFTTNFSEEEIRIYFNEYVKLKNSQQQIVISPPIDPAPYITPLGSPNKVVKIKFNDSVLKPNTTYTVNFGRSIEDNNEGNPLEFFKYVFSTGAYIDSLKLEGSVKDAFKRVPEQFITVALYELNENYKDSIIYNEIPRYITNTLDSATTFQFENLKEGTYKLVAFKDNNNNYKFEPKVDKVAYLQDTITLPTDKTYELTVFKEELDLKFLKPKQIGKQHILFGYEGRPSNTNITLLTDTPDNFEYRVLKDRTTDSLHYWFKPFLEETDSLVFKVESGTYNDTLITRFKDQFADTLEIAKADKINILLNKAFTVSGNTPLALINPELISVVDKDTLNIPFEASLDTIKNTVNVNFEPTESNRYQITFLPEAITDFFNATNDSLSYSVPTKEFSDYGDLFLTVQNVKSYPIIAQLLNNKGEVIYEKYKETESVFEFTKIDPKKYFIRIIYDTNANGYWDTGSYLDKRQPEPIVFYPEEIEIRANSEIYQTFILK